MLIKLKKTSLYDWKFVDWHNENLLTGTMKSNKESLLLPIFIFSCDGYSL